MNHFKLSLTAPLFIMLATTVLSCNQNEKTKSEPTSTSSVSPIDGAWETVSPDGKITEFKMYYDGHFSFLMQDSSGKWSTAGVGSYTVDGNTYKETVRYHSTPAYVGASDWQTFELKGDTLYFEGFNKVVLADGKDVTDQFGKFVEKRVRAK
ncbi:MAG: hypothetical protein ABI091_27090 [Ferruginibacter sp.]